MRIRSVDVAHAEGLVLVTGATGLLGAALVRRWAATRAPMRLAVLVRDGARWQATAAGMGPRAGAVEAMVGDVTLPGLGLDARTRARLVRETGAVVHLAADTTLWRPLEAARRVNRDGTAHLLDALAGARHLTRVALVSTVFVAGRRTGRVPECDDGAATARIGWVNAHEQSKAEAEALVRAAHRGAVILRSSTVACDDASGVVTQRNAVHRALRLLHDGLAAMMPGLPESRLDVVPADYVADAVAGLALRSGVDGLTAHLCAGEGALPLDELLSDTFARWHRDPAWRRRGITPPAIGDLGVWELFLRTVDETRDARLGAIARALSHLVPQLALPRRFDTARADALLGRSAPPVRAYWGRMIDHLQATAWRGVTRARLRHRRAARGRRAASRSRSPDGARG